MISSARAVFEAVDVDDNGYATTRELARWLRAMLRTGAVSGLTMVDLSALIGQLDADADGKLSHDEFIL